MEVQLYNKEHRAEWDAFVRGSKNGTFLFYRAFMEYHADRFTDCSMFFYRDHKLIALLPANANGVTLYTHQGLTYGGLVMSAQTSAKDVLVIFDLLIATLRQQGFEKMVYKAIPHIYHQLPSEEDLYALFRNNAVLSARNISSTISLTNKLAYSYLRNRSMKKAEKSELCVNLSSDLKGFWEILSSNLKTKYNTTPVHTLGEIMQLKNKFADQIHLYSAVNKSDQLLAGCLVFEMDHLVHIQYIAANEEGKNAGAIDLIIHHLITEAYPHKTYLDYGISTEDNGHYLNENLIFQKEGFGARATVYDTYTIDIK